MADIQITSLPSKGTLDGNDFLHVKNTKDGIDYKIPLSVFVNALNIAFTPSAFIQSNNLQAAIEEAWFLNTGGTDGGPSGAGYYKTVELANPIEVTVGPNGTFLKLSDALNAFANTRPELSLETDTALVTITLEPDYTWDEEIVLDAEDFSHIDIKGSEGDVVTVSSTLTGTCLTLSGGCRGPAMGFDINMQASQGNLNFLTVEGEGSLARVTSLPNSDSPFRVSNCKATAISLLKGGELGLSSRATLNAAQELFVVNNASTGLLLSETSHLPGLQLTLVGCSRSVVLVKGSQLSCNTLVVNSVGNATGLIEVFDGSFVSVLTSCVARGTSSSDFIVARGGSSVFVSGLDILNYRSLVDASESQVTVSVSNTNNPSRSVVRADKGSSVSVFTDAGVTFSGTSDSGVLAKDFSRVNLNGSPVTGSGIFDYEVDTLSTIIAGTTSGTSNVTKNIWGLKGLIKE